MNEKFRLKILLFFYEIFIINYYYFIREKINKRKIREVFKEFLLKCRGMFGIEYVVNIGFL